jgi:putative acetyltransferase
MLNYLQIVPIAPEHNAAIAKIIRAGLEEFKANKPGTVYFDASTDSLFELFAANTKSKYFIALVNGDVVGGAGIFPTEGLPHDTCELVKMYLHKSVRGLGLGKKMIDHCISAAKQEGYNKMYLETLPELSKAVKVYESLGFNYLQQPMGNSGHSGCDIWMIRDI